MNGQTRMHASPPPAKAANSAIAASVCAWVRLSAAVLVACSLCACGGLGKPAPPATAFYTLDGGAAGSTGNTTSTGNPTRPASTTPQAASRTGLASEAAPGTGLTLIVSPPQAASGFDSQRMVYVRQNHRLEYFAHSEWVDAPARLLGPLLVSAAQRTGAFAAVVLASGTAAGDLRLGTELLQLQHNFQTQPSLVQVSLRVYLTDEKTRRVLAWQTLSAQAPASSDTPQGGVAAANQAVQAVLVQLEQFLINRPY